MARRGESSLLQRSEERRARIAGLAKQQAMSSNLTKNPFFPALDCDLA
jgi:hypothetical protein